MAEEVEDAPLFTGFDDSELAGVADVVDRLTRLVWDAPPAELALDRAFLWEFTFPSLCGCLLRHEWVEPIRWILRHPDTHIPWLVSKDRTRYVGVAGKLLIHNLGSTQTIHLAEVPAGDLKFTLGGLEVVPVAYSAGAS